MVVEWVVKRNGTVERFQPRKIIGALERAHAHAHGRKKTTEAQWMGEVAHKIHAMRPKQLSTDVIRKIIVDDLNTRNMKKVAEHYDFTFLQQSHSPLKKVEKRSGKIEGFSPKKIYKSIRKAFSAVGVHRERECERLTRVIVRELEKVAGRKPVSVELIREVTEEVLMETGHCDAAHRYMLHRYM